MKLKIKRKIIETDVQDKHGQIVISKGLKVTHKKSKYEYTVDSVHKEQNGNITIMLASPEAPRFDKNKNELIKQKNNSKRKHFDNVLYEIDPQENQNLFYYPDADEDPQEDDLLAVSQKEFEKDYEVK